MADYSVTYDQLDALLQGLDPNTADAPYEIEIATVTASFLTGGGDSPAYGSLRYVLCQNPSKYVSLTWGADALSVIERLSAQPSSEQIYFTAINFLWGATSLVSIDMSHFFSVGGLWMNSFAGCTSLKALDLSNLEIPNFSDLANGCTSLEYVNMTGLTSLYKSEGTFVNCSSLREVNLAGCDNIENSRLMFFGCSNLTSITLPDMSKNMDVSGMFSGCSSLEEIHNWTVPVEADYGRVSGSEDIRCFAGCTSLEHIYTNDTPSQESSWHAWNIRMDTANNLSTVTVYNPDGTSNSVSVPSAGTYTMMVTDKVDELLFSHSEGIPAATIQKMLQTKAPITAKDALDPTKDNFMLLAKDRSSARTNVTTDVIEAGNKLPPTSEAVRAAIGRAIIPTGTFLLYGGSIAPEGFVLCVGETVLRADYSGLLAWAVKNGVIGKGKMFGEGDGSTTFVLPDFRNRGTMGPNPDVEGKAPGNTSNVGDIQEAQLPNITGSLSGNTSKKNWGSSGALSTGGFSGNDEGSHSGSGNATLTIDASKTSSKDHIGNTVYTNNGEVRTANIRLNYIVKF